MAVYNFDGAAGDTLQAAFPTGSIPDNAEINIKRGTTVTGTLPSTTDTWQGVHNGSVTIRPYGSGTAEARIYTRNGFVGDGINGLLDVADVTIEQNISGSFDATANCLKTTGNGGSELAATLTALRVRTINWDVAIKPAGDDSSVSYCSIEDCTKGYVNISGASTDGKTPKNGYVGHNTCFSSRMTGNGAGDGIAIHDGKAGDFGGTGWIIEYNDVDMQYAKENAYDLQVWFPGAIFRYNIARRANQFAYTFGDGGGTGATATRTQVYGNIAAAGCRGGFNCEQNMDVFANFALGITYSTAGGAAPSCMRVNATGIDVELAYNYLEAVSPGAQTAKGVITITSATNGSVRMRNNVLVQNGSGNMPIYHSVNSGYVWGAVSNNRLVQLFNTAQVGRRGNGGTMLNLAAWQALGYDVTGTAPLLNSTAYAALGLNGYLPGKVWSTLIGSGILVPGCTVDARGRRRFNPPSIGPWELARGRAPSLLPRRDAS